MAIESCEHVDYIVVYEIKHRKACPVCEMVRELVDTIKELPDKVKDLEE